MKNLTFIFIMMLVASTVVGQSKLPTLARADSLLQSGDARAAREMYAKVVKDTTRNAGAWSRYGLSNLNLKNYDEAIRLLEKALTKKPVGPVRMNTFASLGRAYAAKGETQKALVNLDSAAFHGYFNLNILDTHDDYAKIRQNEKFKVIRQHIYENANPCMINAKAREFDFWIGDWDVYVTGTKTYAGHNHIEMISGGCAIQENWSSTASTGKSMNFIDPVSGKWKQIWVGSYGFGTQEFVNGEYKDGAMRFTFSGTGPQGQQYIGRFIFYNEKAGQVRQFNERSIDQGKTWVTTYDFTYVKK